MSSLCANVILAIRPAAVRARRRVSQAERVIRKLHINDSLQAKQNVPTKIYKRTSRSHNFHTHVRTVFATDGPWVTNLSQVVFVTNIIDTFDYKSFLFLSALKIVRCSFHKSNNNNTIKRWDDICGHAGSVTS